jgi:hypothetical protein
MRGDRLLIVLSLIFLGLLPDLVEAQIVGANRGYARGPLARAQRSESSRTRARAPLVGIGGRARRSRLENEDEEVQQPKHPRTPFPVPMVPPAQTEPIDKSQSPRDHLLGASGRLRVELLTVQNGAHWRTYLALPESMSSDDPASAPTREELAALWSRFEAIRNNGRYRSVAALPAFATTRWHLKSYIVSLDQQRAVASERQLDDSAQVR